MFTPNSLKTKVYYKSVTFDVILHIFFCYSRISLFCFIFLAYDKNTTFFRELIGRIDDFSYNAHFNFYLQYLFIYSVLKSNIYGYYLAAAVGIHNAALFAIIATSPGTEYSAGIWVTIGLIIGSFLLEAAVTLFYLYIRRFENNNELFKKIGANPRVNQAFSTRKQLELFGGINVFTSTIILFKFLLPPSKIYANVTYLVGLFCLTSHFQQALISYKMEDEGVMQRKVAIALSIIKVGLSITIIVMYNRYSLKLNVLDQPSRAISFLFGDMIIITVIMGYLLTRDLLQFGSGLKDYLKLRTKIIRI